MIKKSFLIVVVLFFSFSLFANPFAFPVELVVLDAGHGGEDPGAVATYHWDNQITLYEKEITLDIVKKVKERLERRNVTVLLTRDSDYFATLSERAQLVSKYPLSSDKSAIFVSIHANSADTPLASGLEILVKENKKWVTFLDGNSEGWKILRYANYTPTQLNNFLNSENLVLAKSLKASLEKSFPNHRFRGIKEQDLWVLNQSKVASALIEIGFMSNEEDALNMYTKSWRDEMASSIANGILNYISGN
ncbi:MAG: N-acetylmuramoyl-L-alanine amidase family protein [Sphaerochaetaceae bacterium]|jgi:N-acetylmuramoyl-L-alanine amidase